MSFAFLNLQKFTFYCTERERERDRKTERERERERERESGLKFHPVLLHLVLKFRKPH